MAVVAMAICVAWSPPLAAQSNEREARQFKQLLADGARHFDAGRYEQALSAFKEARTIASPPSLQYNIGRTLQELNRCQQAKETFQTYLAIEGLSEEKLRKGRRRLREVRDNCQSAGLLVVKCQPSGVDASVRVAGRKAPCPSSHRLEAGAYRIEVRAEGRETVELETNVRPGESSHHTVTLVESSPPAPDAGGPNWRRIAQYGGIGVGGALIVGGVATDLSANRRLREIRAAERADNGSRVRQLRTEAQAARTRGIWLYATGALIAAGSAGWLVYDLVGEGSSDSTAALRLVPTGSGAALRLRW